MEEYEVRSMCARVAYFVPGAFVTLPRVMKQPHRVSTCESSPNRYLYPKSVGSSPDLEPLALTSVEGIRVGLICQYAFIECKHFG
jgi:hypothetical protein